MYLWDHTVPRELRRNLVGGNFSCIFWVLGCGCEMSCKPKTGWLADCSMSIARRRAFIARRIYNNCWEGVKREIDTAHSDLIKCIYSN
jgi:hypothetical protein